MGEELGWVTDDVFKGIPWTLWTGTPWSELPKQYGRRLLVKAQGVEREGGNCGERS